MLVRECRAIEEARVSKSISLALPAAVCGARRRHSAEVRATNHTVREALPEVQIWAKRPATRESY